MNNTWHIWSDSNLESVVNNLNYEDSLTILSAEEAYYPAKTLIEKTIPIDENGWPESFGNYIEFEKKLKNIKSVDIILGTDDPLVVNDYSKLGTVHSWNNFFLYRSLTFLNFEKRSNSIRPAKLFISLNTRAHYHRCLLIDLLFKNQLFDDGIISWHNEPSGWKDSTYRWQYWTPRILSFDKNYVPRSNDRSILQHRLPAEINDAFLMLITETFTSHFFITEKTWHAILAEKPFIVFGSQGFHKKIQDMGFELYKDIIDYSFDLEPDISKRAELIVKELKRLNTMNFFDMNNVITQKIKKNKLLALDMARNEYGIPVLAKNFKCYKEIINQIKTL